MSKNDIKVEPVNGEGEDDSDKRRGVIIDVYVPLQVSRVMSPDEIKQSQKLAKQQVIQIQLDDSDQ